MNDLEQQLTDALSDGAQDAPSAVGLAGAARARARSKRRITVAGVAAAIALCIGVPAAVVAVHGSGDDHSSPSHVANDSTRVPGVPAGQRVESWHGVTALVPDSWGYGRLSSWCSNNGELRPLVERPGALSNDIGCTPEWTYGLQFQELPPGQDRDQVFDWPVVLQSGGGWPDPAYVGAHGIGDVLVQVTAPTEQEALAVLATVRPIGLQGDANGCPVDLQSTPVAPAGGMSVCRYDDLAQLEQSELMTASEVGKAQAAIAAAPEASPGYCPRRKYQGTIVMQSADVSAGVDIGCGDLTVTPGGTRKLTSDVLYWALSPGWSGSVPAGVSLPSELRSP